MCRERVLVFLISTLVVFVTSQPPQAARSDMTGSGEESATESQATNNTSMNGAAGGIGKGALWVAVALVVSSVLVVCLVLTATAMIYTARFGRRSRPQYLGNCRTLDTARREGNIVMSTLARVQVSSEETVTSFTNMSLSQGAHLTAWPQLHGGHSQENEAAATAGEEGGEEGEPDDRESTFETAHSSLGRTYTFPDGAGPKVNIRQGISRPDSIKEDNEIRAQNSDEQDSSHEYCVLGSGPYSIPGSAQPERSDEDPARDHRPQSPVYMGLSPRTKDVDDLETGGYQTIRKGKGPAHVLAEPAVKRPPPKRPPPRLAARQKKGSQSTADSVTASLPSSGYQGLTVSTRDPPSIYMRSALHTIEPRTV